MIKLVHVISDSNIGGAGRYLLTYLRNCNKNEFDISVALPVGSSLIKEIQALGFKIYEIDGLAEKSISYTATMQLFKVFIKIKPDIIHTHACLSARIAAKLAFVKKIVYTRHSVFPQKELLTKGLGKTLNGIMGGYLADGIIAVAEAAKQNLTDTGINPQKAEVIYNGVDSLEKISDDEKVEFRHRLGIDDDEFIIAIIARLELVKGHEYFIDAAEIVKNAGLKARFVIAGTGTRMDALKEYAKNKNLEKLVLFTGFLTEVSKLENIMDVQVNASFGTEAASLSLLEGMSIGKPAVVSDFGGNPELIKNDVNGFVVPKQNSIALAEKIIELLKNESLRDKISKQSIEVFNSRFTSKIMTDSMEKFYKKVCGVKN